MGLIHRSHHFLCITGNTLDNYHGIFGKVGIVHHTEVRCVFDEQRDGRTLFPYDVGHLICIEYGSPDSDVEDIFISPLYHLIYCFFCCSHNAESVFVLLQNLCLIKIKHNSSSLTLYIVMYNIS